MEGDVDIFNFLTSTVVDTQLPQMLRYYCNQNSDFESYKSAEV